MALITCSNCGTDTTGRVLLCLTLLALVGCPKPPATPPATTTLPVTPPAQGAPPTPPPAKIRNPKSPLELAVGRWALVSGTGWEFGRVPGSMDFTEKTLEMTLGPTSRIFEAVILESSGNKLVVEWLERGSPKHLVTLSFEGDDALRIAFGDARLAWARDGSETHVLMKKAAAEKKARAEKAALDQRLAQEEAERLEHKKAQEDAKKQEEAQRLENIAKARAMLKEARVEEYRKLLQTARNYEANGLHKKAAEKLKKALELELTKEERLEAEAQLNQLRARRERHRASDARHHLNMAKHYASQGFHKKAIARLKQALELELSPEDRAEAEELLREWKAK